MTLTETRIEIADRHTTVYYLSGKDPNIMPLPLRPRTYAEFCRRLEGRSVAYATVTGGREGQVINKMCAAYSREKYWRRYLDQPPNAFLVWDEGLPFVATIKPRIKLVTPSSVEASVSPIPRVLIYPFGWSTWISIRVNGVH